MDKNQTNNKIGESFENQIPDEQIPEFIWDNISEALDTAATPIESTAKIKNSFEEGFEEEVLPAFIWGNIEGDLNAKPPLDTDLVTTNKIKTSFEEKYQEDLPSSLWNNVEEQLEIETVWQQVNQVLNRRTRRRYWQEKGMQLGLVAMAILWLRGCGIEGGFMTKPMAIETAQPKIELVQSTAETTNTLPKSMALLKKHDIVASTEEPKKLENVEAVHNAKDAAINASLPTTNIELRKNRIVAQNDIPSTVVSKESYPNSSLPSGIAGDKKEVSSKEASIKKEPQNNTVKTIINNHSTTKVKTPTAKNGQENEELANHLVEENLLKTTINTSIDKPTNIKVGVDKTASLELSKVDPTITNLAVTEELTIKKLFKEDMLPTIVGQEISTTILDPVDEFEIQAVANKKRHALRFELGMDAKMGTSLLLGTATSRAMETTSMLKTKMRLAGSVGVLLNAYLTANDAIVFGAYPFASNQQYFGGYTSEGRYYHKEIKLAYFDLTLGYQRVLFHYNDFGTIPSSMYARVDYGFGYLSKGEEVINGVAIELGDSYNKINHNLGLTIGSTHRIKRFVIDYGIYANMGVSSVLNHSPSGATTMEYSHLLNMGGHIGLRYVL